MTKQRRDADRRVRQCERFARLIRITRLLLGHGRWGPDDLAKEINCSSRTVFRDIQTLCLAGIPVRFDRDSQAYQLPEGFRFPGIDSRRAEECLQGDKLRPLINRTKKLVQDAQELIAKMEELCLASEATSAK